MPLRGSSILRFAILLTAGTCSAAPPPAEILPPARYRDFAMSHDGNSARGRDLFFAEDKGSCFKCHNIDGTSGRAGPDLFAVGEKFPRSELIQSILEPSAAIAVGYGATTVETKSGDQYLGVLKQVTDASLELISADGKTVRIATADIKEQRGST